MANNKSVEIDGEIYTCYNGIWVDSSYTQAPVWVVERIVKEEISVQNLDTCSITELTELLNQLKNHEMYADSLRVLDKLIGEYERSQEFRLVGAYLSQKTSFLRKSGSSEEAVKCFERMYAKYQSKIATSALYTSVAAAYCDLDNWEQARLNANRAHALSGGKSTEELMSVYSRIKKHEQ